jgi:hypothetical protein
MTDTELRELAVLEGVSPAGDKLALIRRIEERGVAYVNTNEDRGIHRQEGDADDPGYDPDAQAIGDETLRTLPEGHPGWNDVADPAVIRAPDQADEAPTSDHRAPETRDSGEAMSPDDLSGRAASTLLEHDSSQETEVAGVMSDRHPDEGEQTVTTEESQKQAEAERQALAQGSAVAPATAGSTSTDTGGKDAGELTGDDLDAAVSKAGIDTSKGGSLADGSMSADEKRAALKARG